MTAIQEAALEVLRARYRQEYDLSLRSPIHEGDDERLRETAQEIAAVLPIVAEEVRAAQEETAAEVDAGMAAAAQSMPAAWWGGTEWRRYVEEILSAARAARRDEEKRDD